MNLDQILSFVRRNWLAILAFILLVVPITIMMKQHLLPLEAYDHVKVAPGGATAWYAPGGAGVVVGWPDGPLFNWRQGWLESGQEATVTPKAGYWFVSYDYYRVIWIDPEGRTNVGWVARGDLIWVP